MTLQQWLDNLGYTKEVGGNKACCPFHRDNTFSAYVNSNTLYCFSCAKCFKLYHFKQEFGVDLEYVQEKSKHQLKMESLQAGEEEVLFTYPFN